MPCLEHLEAHSEETWYHNNPPDNSDAPMKSLAALLCEEAKAMAPSLTTLVVNDEVALHWTAAGQNDAGGEQSATLLSRIHIPWADLDRDDDSLWAALANLVRENGDGHPNHPPPTFSIDQVTTYMADAINSLPALGNLRSVCRSSPPASVFVFRPRRHAVLGVLAATGVPSSLEWSTDYLEKRGNDLLYLLDKLQRNEQPAASVVIDTNHEASSCLTAARPAKRVTTTGLAQPGSHNCSALKELWDVVRLYPVATLCPPLLCFVLLAALGLWGAVAGAQAAAQQRMDGTRSQAVDAATGFQIQLQQSYTPGVTFQLLVKQRPDLGYWVEHFNATAQELLTRVPNGSLWNLQLQPFAQVLQIHPTRPEDMGQLVPARDLLGDPARRGDVLKAITTGAPAVNGPLVTAQDETFGFRYRENATALPYSQLPASVRGCAVCYNATTRTKWWGLLTAAVNLDAVTRGQDAYLSQLRSRGNHYELVRRINATAEQLIARVGATASLRGSGAVEVDFRVLDSTWTMRVVPSDGFQPSWRGPVIAAVVVVSLLVAALLFVALAFFKRQRLLLQETVAALESLAETTQRLEQEKERMDVLLARQYDLLACLEANGRGKRHKPLQRSNSQANMLLRIEEARASLNHAKTTSTDEPIQVFELLGQGAFGKVQKGLWRGTVVAVKTMILPANMTGQQKREKMAVMEAAISSSLVHPNIVTTYTYFIRPYHEPTHEGVQNMLTHGEGTPRKTTAAGEGRGVEDGGSEGLGSLDESGSDEAAIHSFEVRLVLEFCDKGSLKDALDQHAFMQAGVLNMPAILDTAADIAKAMVHMHAASVLHSDLKARNIMLKSGGTGGRGVVAKVADFGLSTRMEHQETHLSSCFQGTLTHMAPEVMLEGRISKAADVYSFGILMWELFCASDPFAGVPRAHMGHAITKENRRPKFPPFAPRDYVALASQCWHPDASQRPTFEAILSELTRMREELGGDTPQLVILPPKPASANCSRSNSFRVPAGGSFSRCDTDGPTPLLGSPAGNGEGGQGAASLASGTPMQLYVAGIVIGDSTAGDSAAGGTDAPDADAATGGGSAGGGLAALGSLGLLPGQGLGHSAVAARAMLKKALTQRHFRKMGLRMGGSFTSGSSWSGLMSPLAPLPALIEEHEKAEESDLLPKLASAPTTGGQGLAAADVGDGGGAWQPSAADLLLATT
ncbi:hypothetical protein HYH03_001411 [Edaphochlamys debaryana]|uniref:Protein kinase domain-containing protein n=1 Tax=Edaphochlamys debaryana TaxID=47281 RepID=A0A835YMY2_9CHLO|nr:hypothetical protein HYH03_001411 [Edaphochlamys debaryana]|eukprot:KAG2500644.1 hypothetical protein HYH03_001411 [Edaphochlamys debaryana]